jgi:hypothetical protein
MYDGLMDLSFPAGAEKLGFLGWRAHLTHETVSARFALPLANRSRPRSVRMIALSLQKHTI